MKLLLDENLSRRLVPALQPVFPASTQVALVGLKRADDRLLWDFARSGDYVIVTKDRDFVEIQSLRGYPPKIVLLAGGNRTNQEVADVLLRSHAEITAALSKPDIGLVEIY